MARQTPKPSQKLQAPPSRDSRKQKKRSKHNNFYRELYPLLRDYCLYYLYCCKSQWMNQPMMIDHCPYLMLLLIFGQIGCGDFLRFLFKDSYSIHDVKFTYEKQKGLDGKLNKFLQDVIADLKKNDKRLKQEKKKMRQIFKAFLPTIHIALRFLYFGDQDLEVEIVDQLNKQFGQVIGDNKIQGEIGDIQQFNMEDYVQPIRDMIQQRAFSFWDLSSMINSNQNQDKMEQQTYLLKNQISFMPQKYQNVENKKKLNKKVMNFQFMVNQCKTYQDELKFPIQVKMDLFYHARVFFMDITSQEKFNAIENKYEQENNGRFKSKIITKVDRRMRSYYLDVSNVSDSRERSDDDQQRVKSNRRNNKRQQKVIISQRQANRQTTTINPQNQTNQNQNMQQNKPTMVQQQKISNSQKQTSHNLNPIPNYLQHQISCEESFFKREIPQIPWYFRHQHIDWMLTNFDN